MRELLQLNFFLSSSPCATSCRRYLFGVNHPASIYKQQHVVNSLFDVFGENFKATRPGCQRGLENTHTDIHTLTTRLGKVMLHFCFLFTWYSSSLISLATLSVNLASGTGAGFWGAPPLWLNHSVNASWASCNTVDTTQQRLYSSDFSYYCIPSSFCF